MAARSGRRRVAGGDHHADERAGLAVRSRLGEWRHHRRQPHPAHHRPSRPGGGRQAAPALGGGLDRAPDHRAQQPAGGRPASHAARRPGPKDRSPSCRARSSTSASRSWPSTSRARPESRGRAGASPARRSLSWSPTARGRRPHGRARVPARAGQHHRGRHVGDHAQHPRRARARPARRSPTPRGTCRGKTSRARSDRARSAAAGRARRGERAVEEVGVDRVVDARALRVRGVLGAVEGEQPRARDASGQILGARVRRGRVAPSSRRSGSGASRSPARHPAPHPRPAAADADRTRAACCRRSCREAGIARRRGGTRR